MIKKNIVLWRGDTRVGSVPKTKLNMDRLKKEFYLVLIEEDVTGSVHYSIDGSKK